MPNSFKPLKYDSINVGKHIKSSKKRHSWKFELDSKEHQIDLFVSRISGKRTMIVDGSKKIETRKAGLDYDTTYPTKIGVHPVILHEFDGGKFDLTVGSSSFEAIYKYCLKIGKRSFIDNLDSENEVAYVSNYEKYFENSPPKNLQTRASTGVPSANQPRFSMDNTYEKQLGTADPFKPRSVSMLGPQVKIQTETKSQPLTQIDLLAPTVPDLSTIPSDLFAALESTNPSGYSNSGNPFEIEEKFEFSQAEPLKEQKNNTFNLFDLDNLHLGDGYSPAVAKKLEEANKPISYVPTSVPNMPLNQMQTNNPQSYYMNQPQMMNPMMMAYGQYMTNMINPWAK